MNVLWMLSGAVLVLLVAGRWYSQRLARVLGENEQNRTPAVAINDGRDYVPTRTPIVFAHHFASIAGAGPILGPVVAMYYGWAPVLAWLLLGGLFIGAVHDYAATHMAMREGGRGIVHVARIYLGKTAFVMMAIMVVALLALVCAAFLNLSAAALGSMVPVAEMGIKGVEKWFRVQPDPVNGQPVAVVGGVASMSVVVISCCAPLLGYLYIKRGLPVWICSLLAVVICVVSLYLGLLYPIAISPTTWKVLISIYVLAASGLPVWLLIQSRDFINVHILYVGIAFLLVALVGAGLGGASASLSAGDASATTSSPIPMHSIAQAPAGGMLPPGQVAALGPIWPGLFILIACGAVSGFHALCAGGTTCKQLNSERAARRVGYWAMILETFLAVCVAGVMAVGLSLGDYVRLVHPAAMHLGQQANWILGFAMAVGHTAETGLGVPKAYGIIGAMLMLEGFLVTTLDTAVRLTRYLLEEIWAALLEKRSGSEGAEVADASSVPLPATGGLGVRILRHYWFNSGLAVALMLVLALSNGVGAIWPLFASGNQLLAALALLIASVWLFSRGRATLYTLIPGLLVLVTTMTMLVKLLWTYIRTWSSAPKPALLIADSVLLTMTLVVLVAIVLKMTRPVHRQAEVPVAAGQ